MVRFDLCGRRRNGLRAHRVARAPPLESLSGVGPPPRAGDRRAYRRRDDRRARAWPLRFQPKEWNAASFNDILDGRILVNNGVTRGMVSMAGNGSGSQRVLVRADLLVSPQRLVSTEFQMEYLPSGALCMGHAATQVHGSSFQATCHLPDGSNRSISANWDIGTSTDGEDRHERQRLARWSRAGPRR